MSSGERQNAGRWIGETEALQGQDIAERERREGGKEGERESVWVRGGDIH